MKTLRLQRGFTFDAFVEESALGRGYVSQMERGLVVPTLTTLVRIAAALELHLLDLLALGPSPVDRFVIAARDLPPADVERLVRAAERLATKARGRDEAERKSLVRTAPSQALNPSRGAARSKPAKVNAAPKRRRARK